MQSELREVSAMSETLPPPPPLPDAWGALPAAPSSRYRVRRLLGAGGMGDVYRCEEVAIGREVALKTLRLGSDASRESAERFLCEARLQARLEHPAIVPVYEIGTTEASTPFFTMKEVRGITLAEVISDRRDGRSTCFSLHKLLTAFAQVCLAVDYAHRRGVVHCDLKPGNLMFGPFGEIHVLDWGCARSSAASEEPRCGVDSLEVAAAQPGLVVGTLGYMAPEQASGADVDARTDVYSLGAILFEILTLEPLHAGPTLLATIRSTLDGVEGRPSSRRPDASIPAPLDDLVVQALAMSPRDRPASTRELADRVEAYLEGELQAVWVRDSAAHHAYVARRAADESGPQGAGTSREDALRAAGRALALDPENEAARELLGTLLVHPPTIAPPEAQRDLEEVDRRVAGYAMRTLGMRVALWTAIVPLVLSLGIRSWAWGTTSLAAMGALGATLAIAKLRGGTQRPWQLALLAMTSMAVATFSALFGPFLLVPTLSATVATGFAMFFGSRDRWVAIALGIAAILVPFALEASGVVAPSTHLARDGILLLPRLAWFPRNGTLAVLIVGNVLAIPVNVVIAGRLRDALGEARRKLALYAWQLERTLPTRFAERRD